MYVQMRESDHFLSKKNTETGVRNIVSLMVSAETKVDAMIITDDHGNVEFVNRAFELMTGYRRAGLIGRSLQSVHLGLSDSGRNPKFWNDIQRGKSRNVISIHCKKDGSRFHHEQCVRPFFDVAGMVTHAVLTSHDVSQRVSETPPKRLSVKSARRFRTDSVSRKSLYMPSGDVYVIAQTLVET